MTETQDVTQSPSLANSEGSKSTSSATLGQRLSKLWSFRGEYRVLHLTWFAFFLSFVVWFNFAPFAATIGEQLHLSKAQLATLGLCNVALTVPARIFMGMALDRFGPRRTYSIVLVYAAIPCTMFALANSFGWLVLSRLLIGVVGTGFVVGIRMVSEWFPPRELGTAEGVYGGWGNFGASAAAFGLPAIAAWAGGPNGWRWATGLSGLIAAFYGLYYARAVDDTPAGAVFSRPKRQGALEVTSRAAVFGLAGLTVPVFGVLGLILWRVWSLDVISTAGLVVGAVVVVLVLATQLVSVFRVNRPAMREEYPAEDRYPMSSVAVLCLAYFCTFGSELAVVSMLPAFFSDSWGLGVGAAGLAASSFAFMNIVTRPGGGLMSDLAGSRRRTLVALLVGVAVGNVVLSTLGSGWPLALAIIATMAGSIFCQAGNGAVYAIVPLVKKRVSGQVAGLAGAYGNVGGVVFLTAFLYVGPRGLFLVIAGCSAVTALVAALWLREPEASFAHHIVVDERVTIDLTDPTEVSLGGLAGAGAIAS